LQKRSTRRPGRVRRTGGRLGKASAEGLEVQREALLDRLGRLHADARSRPGYRTAHRLLNPMFRKANLATRAALLQAAGFMIEILEMTPPFL
jgi:hypothetical protein